MTDAPSEPDEPIEDVVSDAADGAPESTTRREAVELELGDQGRSDEGSDVEIADVVDDPHS